MSYDYKNKIRDLFKVKLYTIRSETEKREREKLCVSEVETSLNLLDKVNTDVNKMIDSTHEHK